MDIRGFSKEIIAVTPPMHAMFVRGLPKALKGGMVTFPQMVVMEMLRAKKECKMSDISKALGVTKSAVTGLVDRLIRARLVRRERLEADRRIVKVSLTRKGAGISDTIRDYNLKIIGKLFRNISQKERAQYLAILKKVQKNLAPPDRQKSHA